MANYNYQTVQLVKTATPSRVPANSKAQAVGGAVKLLHRASIALNSFALSKRVEDELKKLEPRIEKVLPEKGGVLVIIGVKEWAIPDATGTRARSYLSMHIAGAGSSPKTVLGRYRSMPQLVQGTAKGWRRVEEYVWVTATN
jgi:hypothetical protein